MSEKNNTLDKMAAQFNTVDDLKVYCDAQFKTIQRLTAQINEIRKENDEWKDKYIKLKESKNALEANQIINQPKDDKLTKLGVTSQEAICIMQLEFIKQSALVRELTLEETKKVEILVKTLDTIRNVPKKIEIDTKDMSNEQLIKLIEASVDSPKQ